MRPDCFPIPVSMAMSASNHRAGPVCGILGALLLLVVEDGYRADESRFEPAKSYSLLRLLAVLLGLISVTAVGQQTVDHTGHEGHSMEVKPAGMVMNENHDGLAA